MIKTYARRASLFALAALALTAPAFGQALTTVRVASGLARPVGVVNAPGDTGRAFIIEQRSGSTGRIRVLDLSTNTLLATPFLSVSSVSTGNEQGLLGAAFHPDYQTNGRFFVNYTTAGGGTAGRTVVAEYVASPPSANVANATVVQTIIRYNQPESNHNGGWMGFGADGYLYIASGDGGGGNDQHGATGNGQNIDTLLGKILRIDVDGDDFPADANANYRIPPTNPFAGATPGSDEIWAYGLRNPWRNGFDRLTGDLWIADVGQNAIEEVNFEPAATPGRNYGWRCMEGFNCTGLSGCTCNAPTLTLPVHTFSHAGGNCSVTGGYVYRGCAMPELGGTYFFADYCSAQIWSFRYDTVNGLTDFTNRTAELAPGGGFSIASITAFGEDALGEIYICDQGGGAANGEVFKIVPVSILHDCNLNGRSDACDIALGSSTDADNDGRPDECCPSDIDDNGFVNGEDFDTWIQWFIDGNSLADYNHDTFITGEDFDEFVDDFAAGC